MTFSKLALHTSFRESEGGCVALVVPENGHLNNSGKDWECDTFFQRNGDTCLRPN